MSGPRTRKFLQSRRPNSRQRHPLLRFESHHANDSPHQPQHHPMTSLPKNQHRDKIVPSSHLANYSWICPHATNRFAPIWFFPHHRGIRIFTAMRTKVLNDPYLHPPQSRFKHRNTTGTTAPIHPFPCNDIHTEGEPANEIQQQREQLVRERQAKRAEAWQQGAAPRDPKKASGQTVEQGRPSELCAYVLHYIKSNVPHLLAENRIDFCSRTRLQTRGPRSQFVSKHRMLSSHPHTTVRVTMSGI